MKLWPFFIALLFLSLPTWTQEEENNEDDYYVGISVGYGQGESEITDTEGFANWGHPGWTVGDRDDRPVFGLLLGRKFDINGIPLKIELDGLFGDIATETNQLDPEGLDETATMEIPWLFTARVGLEKDLGPMTVGLDGGLALARISNSVVDIDFAPEQEPWEDPDDSFHDSSTHAGWVIGLGTEIPLDEKWSLRVDGHYIDFGSETYQANHSGNNSCGPDGPQKPCSYKVKNKVSTVLLRVVRRFSLR